LKKGKRKMLPREVIFFDSETKQQKYGEKSVYHVPFLCCATYVDLKGKYSRDEQDFETINDFWDWVVSKCKVNKTLFLIAHNTDFDFRVMKGFTSLDDQGFYLHKFICENGRFILRYANYPKIINKENDCEYAQSQKKRKYIVVLDTLNWFKVPLRVLGDMIGLPKMDMPKLTDSLYQWIEYCRNDVNIIEQVFREYVDFIEKERLGSFGYTIASQAFNAFVSRFMKHTITIHASKPVTEIERKGYYGGRTECFFIGQKRKGHYYMIDVNSMYPFVMRNNDYPVECMGYRSVISKEVYSRMKDNSLYIADVDIEVYEPCVPYRGKEKLLFPVGNFRTVLCKPELDLVERHGRILKLHKVVFYRGEKIFGDYVNTLYSMRLKFKKDKNKVYENFVKILLNSLYGKFGQRNEEYEYVGDYDMRISEYKKIYSPRDKKEFKYKIVDGKVFKSIGVREGYHSFPAISAFVTSYARVYLWELISKAGIHNVFYCDTDSLIVNREGYERLEDLLHETELGKLKVEEYATEFKLYGLKDYVFGSKKKIKGVGVKGIYKGKDTYLVERWEKFNGSLHNNRMETVITELVEKHLTRKYDKGIITSTGRVKPLVIGIQQELW